MIAIQCNDFVAFYFKYFADNFKMMLHYIIENLLTYASWAQCAMLFIVKLWSCGYFEESQINYICKGHVYNRNDH